MDKERKRELIIDNYQNPVNKGLVDDEKYVRVNTSIDSCIDDLNIAIYIDDEIIKDMCFDGEACAISTSATSILIKTLKGKSIKDVRSIVSNYEKMINNEEYDDSLLGDLVVYDEIYMQPNRVKCAMLPIDAIKKIINY